ncbi:hypothetical protein AHiyo6_11920 [Arthrobacter sp. Hiyo6]|nr:hypothetical protein AHiyo6_11920 [Arthrobacter sp. Hiyo6]
MPQLGGIGGKVNGGELTVRGSALEFRFGRLEADNNTHVARRGSGNRIGMAGGVVANRQPSAVNHHRPAVVQRERDHHLVPGLAVEWAVAYDPLAGDVVAALQFHLRPFAAGVERGELITDLRKRNGGGGVVGGDPVDLGEGFGAPVHLPAAQKDATGGENCSQQEVAQPFAGEEKTVHLAVPARGCGCVVESCGVHASRLLPQPAGPQVVLEPLPVGTACQPDLASLRRVDLRIVPQQLPVGGRTAAFGNIGAA